jgi:hypothetical protein
MKSALSIIEARVASEKNKYSHEDIFSILKRAYSFNEFDLTTLFDRMIRKPYCKWFYIIAAGGSSKAEAMHKIQQKAWVDNFKTDDSLVFLSNGHDIVGFLTPCDSLQSMLKEAAKDRDLVRFIQNIESLNDHYYD